ncbi:MAG: hypothetical protein HQ471_03690 [Flavobacteriales bacterium]|nr:hypothetical protein [Flavobacteriales bacterium]
MTDSGNISMEYEPETQTILGQYLNNRLRIGLQLTNLEIKFLDQNQKPIKTIELNGKTFEQGYGELRFVLASMGIDTLKLKTEQPYTLPSDSLVSGKFSVQNRKQLQIAADLRHNADIIISEYSSYIKDLEPVRIWPHHFDSGTYFSSARNKLGEVSGTIGLGWAIPDTMVDEPYFYLSFWSKEKINDFNPDPLPFGKWMLPNWNGAVLKHNQIVNEKNPEQQFQMVKHFFNSGLKVLTHFFKQIKYEPFN